MANRVVNALEMIHVDHDQTNLPLALLAVYEVTAQLLGKASPVRKIGQMIKIGEIAEVVFF